MYKRRVPIAMARIRDAMHALLVVTSGMAVILAAHTAPESDAQLAWAQAIENDRQYIGDDGSLHIVGEIVNDLDVPLRGATVSATIYDHEGAAVTTKEAASLVNTIMPGMKGPFDVILAGWAQSAAEGGSVQYELDLAYDFATPKEQVIGIAESDIARDRHGNIIISGMVSNNGEITANTISVVATIYDGAGDVAAVTRVHPEPDYLRAGESAFFVAPMPDNAYTEGASRYDLVAESEEYAAVPEFPIGTTILLAGTFAAYVAVTRVARFSTINLIAATGSR